MTKSREKGFALTDALIAAAIAAGVTAAAAQSLGVAARSAQASSALSAVVAEAEIISERLDAGMRDEALVSGFDDWTIEVAPFAHNSFEINQDNFEFQKFTISHMGAPMFSFERIVASAATQ